jgi:hypothetical protein
MRVNRVVIYSKAAQCRSWHCKAKQLKAIRIGHSNVPLPKCFHFKCNAWSRNQGQRAARHSKDIRQGFTALSNLFRGLRHRPASNRREPQFIEKQRDKASALSGRFDLTESLGIALKRKDAHGSEMIFG